MDGMLNCLTGLSVVLFIMVLVSVRRQHIRVEYSVSWCAAAFVLFVLSRSRVTLHWLADVLGIGSPPLALLMLVGCLFLLVLFRFSGIISKLKDANIALAQRIAILEYHLEAAYEKDKHKNG